MVLHRCKLCNYSTKYTTNYKKHMDSKKTSKKYENPNGSHRL